MTATLDLGLSTMLRDHTRVEHDEAENSRFITRLMSGQVGLRGYAELLGQLYPIYAALEAAGRTCAEDPILGPCLAPELERLPSLEADLAYLDGPRWRDRLDPAPATLAYVERIRTVAAEWPTGLIAHHYTRYLGDLAGGQAIRATVRRLHGLEGDDGTRFFVFERIPSAKRFRDAYRETLDSLPLGPADRLEVADEARVAFRHNRAVFDALDARFTS